MIGAPAPRYTKLPKGSRKPNIILIILVLFILIEKLPKGSRKEKRVIAGGL